MSKEIMQEALDALPQDFDIEEFLERITLLEKIKRSQERADRGETTTFEEMKQLAQSWQK